MKDNMGRRAGLGVCLAILAAMGVFAMSDGATEARALTTEALLDTLQHTAFDYFWNEANPANGLIRDRSASWSPCSIAATGFGFSAICIGIDHGWVSREDGRARIMTALQTLYNGPQGPGLYGNIGYKGLFYHFLDMNTAVRTWDCELSTIDTALLFAGIFHARQYFSTSDPLDAALREQCDLITERADWAWTQGGTTGIRMGWKPETEFSGFGTWIGYNEAMILYIMAIGSPTHPIPGTAWSTWTTGYTWGSPYGFSYVIFPPLFGHQYSHCWIDFRGLQDWYMRARGIDYFENSRRATYAQQTYCIDNPLSRTGYSSVCWGLTASDDPWGYSAHGTPPAQNDNGTITPTAAASSIAFAPEIVIPTLHNFYDSFAPNLWGPYGFKDAFNQTVNWWATDVIGIDQGPIIIMIENYRTGAVWQRAMRSPDLQRGLLAAGFTGLTGVADGPGGPASPSTVVALRQAYPNPFRGSTVVSFQLPKEGWVSLRLYDVRGRLVRTLVDGIRPAGPHEIVLDGAGLASGTYVYRLESHGQQVWRRCTLIE